MCHQKSQRLWFLYPESLFVCSVPFILQGVAGKYSTSLRAVRPVGWQGGWEAAEKGNRTACHSDRALLNGPGVSLLTPGLSSQQALQLGDSETRTVPKVSDLYLRRPKAVAKPTFRTTPLDQPPGQPKISFKVWNHKPLQEVKLKTLPACTTLRPSYAVEILKWKWLSVWMHYSSSSVTK